MDPAVVVSRRSGQRHRRLPPGAAMQLMRTLDGARTCSLWPPHVIVGGVPIHMKNPNEQAALAAVAEILPYLTGTCYDSAGSPDESNRDTPDVDLVLLPVQGGRPPVAVEHTVLEAFQGQLRYVRRSYDVVAAVQAECQGNLPSDRFFALILPPELESGFTRTRIARFTAHTAEWVLRTAPGLRAEAYVRTQYGPHSLLLFCGGSNPALNGQVVRANTGSRDPADAKARSFLSAVDHGLTKLARYKQTGHDTVLALEDVSGEFHGLCHPAFWLN